MSYDSTIHAKAIELNKLNFDITAAAGSGHPSTGASLAHIITVLMYDHMRYEPANPAHPSSDRLVLSEGHAVPIVYAACADLGVYIGKDPEKRRAMTRDDALTLRDIDSLVDGHPNPVEGFPFFDSATGSLGQGLSAAAGLAIADKHDGVGKRFFCIIGDGESREGQIWEAIDFIKDHNLQAVCPIFNCNELGQSDYVSHCQAADVTHAKLQAIGYEVLDIDGHNPTELKNAFERHAATMDDPNTPPIAIIARTVKGWGAPSEQGNGHHGQAAKGEMLEKVKEELDQTARQYGAVADTTLKRPLMPSAKPPVAKVDAVPTLTQVLEQFGESAQLDKGKMATRRAYGYALRALGHARSDVFALDGDVQGSTYASMFATDEALKDRFYEGKIAEQNMVSVAVGLSAAKKQAYVSTFGKFLTRAYDQIEMGVNSGANLRLVGSHAGISLGADGPSQMAMPDVAWFRAFSTMKRHDGKPGFYILQPADAFAAYGLVKLMAEYDGSCYMRTHRPDVEFLYDDETEFTLGGHEVLIEGKDLLICTCGYMVHEVNKALDALDDQGIDATVVDMYSIPFDEEAILDLANANNGMILTVEDNYGGGLGSAVADAVAEDGGGFSIKQLHLRQLPKSGKSGDDVLKYCGLSHEDIAKAAMETLELNPA